MQIKSLRFSIFLMLFLVSTFYLPSTFAQDYTQWHLPEGAKVRLGDTTQRLKAWASVS